MNKIRESYGLSDEVWTRKALMVRSLLFGAVFMFDSGEFTYNEDSLNHIRYLINREFEIL
jgi:hypothetical protein